MPARRHVFLTEQQRASFEALSRAWGGSHRIFYNLPFEAVFDLGLVADANFRTALTSSSIPYTLCERDGAPRLCVEFDELGEGISIGDSYESTLPTSAQHGRLIRLKLAVARANGFPYVVVSSMYFNALSEQTESSILDGIIGEVLGGQVVRERVASFSPAELNLSPEEFESLADAERTELVLDWVTGLEVEAELALNPIHRRTSELAARAGHPPHARMGLTRPEPPPGASFEERLEALQHATHEGGRVWVGDGPDGRVECDVWLSRFDLPGYSGLAIAQEIAYLCALELFITREPQAPTRPHGDDD